MRQGQTAHAVSVLAQFSESHKDIHWAAAKRVLRYLKSTINCSICYRKGESEVLGYVDADWGRCRLDRRSYTGFVFTYGEGPIFWKSQKQTTEVEYMAPTEATKNAVYLKEFLAEIELRHLPPTTIFNDNLGHNYYL